MLNPPTSCASSASMDLSVEVKEMVRDRLLACEIMVRGEQKTSLTFWKGTCYFLFHFSVMFS